MTAILTEVPKDKVLRRTSGVAHDLHAGLRSTLLSVVYTWYESGRWARRSAAGWLSIPSTAEVRNQSDLRTGPET